uniref:glutathione transferase n=1 Tax=Falco tinnunculus TaxID=100819 RepID=A0A8C4U2J9_FALTI
PSHHPSLLQEKLKPGYLEQLPGKLKLFSNFLGDRKWFAGEKLTFVDFLMFDVLEQNRIFEPKCLEPFKNLKDFMDRFGVSEATPAVTLLPWGRSLVPGGIQKWGDTPVGGVSDIAFAPRPWRRWLPT